MKREAVTCHACGWEWRKPFPASIADAPWGDCACKDRGPCFYHRMSLDPMPDRPADDVLQARADEITRRRMKEWEEKRRALASHGAGAAASGTEWRADGQGWRKGER